MPQYVAFLRAINVGGHTVKMDRLRSLFEEMGLEDVSTFIASGNVLFESPATDLAVFERKVEAHLHAALGYEVGTFIRTGGELAAVAGHPPFLASEVEGEGSLYVCFLPSAVDEDVASRVADLCTPSDELRLHGRELYWLCRTRISDSAVNGAQLARVLGLPSTMRNMNTVRRILAKFPSQD